MAAYSIHCRRLAQVRNVLLVRNAQDQNAAALYRFTHVVERVLHLLHPTTGHVGVDLSLCRSVSAVSRTNRADGIYKKRANTSRNASISPRSSHRTRYTISDRYRDTHVPECCENRRNIAASHVESQDILPVGSVACARFLSLPPNSLLLYASRCTFKYGNKSR